jgi:hypothetical protein
LGDHGLLGERVYAFLDSSDGKVATAKNPSKWPSLFAFWATAIAPSGSGAQVPLLRMTLLDGAIMTRSPRRSGEAWRLTVAARTWLCGGRNIERVLSPSGDASTAHTRRHPMAISNPHPGFDDSVLSEFRHHLAKRRHLLPLRASLMAR